MSTELLENEISRFLASPKPEVLCLRGKWGIGKTYSWNSFLLQAKNANKIELKKYSYVSLFGVNSLDQFRYAIFENTVKADSIGSEPSVETLQSNVKSLLSGRKGITTLLGALPWTRSSADTFQSLSFLSVANTIICIDDIERKGEKLQIKDVFGLISQLRERRGCKIVLILNEEELSPEDQDEYAKYNEKVIDYSLSFTPSPEDAARIGLTEESAIRDSLATSCIALKISNIRIIKKIERLSLRVNEILIGFDSRIFQQYVQTGALFGWIVYSGNSPMLEFILKKRGKSLYGLTKGNDLTDSEKAWDLLLDDYGFRVTDEFDLVILDGIKTGYFDVVKLKNAASKLNEQIVAQKSQESLEGVWRLYHDSFDDNEAEVVEKIYATFLSNIKFISPINLDGTVRFLKYLGHADKAETILSRYMDERGEGREFYDLSENAFGDEVKDEDVKAAFSRKLGIFVDDRNPADVLIEIEKNSGWGDRDIKLLRALTSDDFYRIFKTVRGTDLARTIQASLKFERVAGIAVDTKEISVHAREALIRIAGESRINRKRVEKYGITIVP